MTRRQSPYQRGWAQPFKHWRVTIHCEGYADETYEVDAPDEWKARSVAQLRRPLDSPKHNGAFVDYTVVELS